MDQVAEQALERGPARGASRTWLAIAAVLVIGAFIALVCEWDAITSIDGHDVDWGTVPDWLAGIGTLVALYVLFREWRKARLDSDADQLREQEAKDREALARRQDQVHRVTAWPVVTPGNGLQDLVAKVMNASSMAIYDVTVEVPSLGLPSRALPVVAPEGQEQAIWQAVRLDASEAPTVIIELTDAAGIRWRRERGSFEELSGASEPGPPVVEPGPDELE